jgi:ABC-type glycerol-3-phosphate transport system permease component
VRVRARLIQRAPSFGILAVFSILAVVPFLWAFFSSFKNTSEIFSGVNFIPRNWRWNNYTDAWRVAAMGLHFKNSLIITAMSVSLILVVCTLAGYSFAKLRLRRHSWLFYLYFVGLAVPGQVTALSIFFLLRSLELNNTRVGLILALTGTAIAFSTFLMRTFFMDIPDELGESAQMDGASPLRTFLSVYLPLSTPAVLALAIFSFMGVWNEFYLTLVVLADDKLWTIPVAIAAFWHQFTNYGRVFAASIISVIPTIILYAVFQRSFVQGITVGALKL